MKRSRETRDKNYQNTVIKQQSENIDAEFVKECETAFYKDKNNIVARNAVVAIGSQIATINSDRANEISHIFLNTLKKKDVKATNQGNSGRCWMFAGLNMFRHSIIKALNLENFEFSETYLFFWDKLERSNYYLRWFIENSNVEPGSHSFKFMTESYMDDGGWYNFFANLVMKYGLVPKNAMKETFQSCDSEDMNKILTNRLQSTANFFMKNRKRLQISEMHDLRKDTLKEIYSTLVKFLGTPPKTFKWEYTDDDDLSSAVLGLTPLQFREMVIPTINTHDFIILAHVPTKQLQYNKLYNITCTNIYEGKEGEFINLPMRELVKYAKKSVLSGFPVWFGSDVSVDFNFYHSCLDDTLTSEETIFGKTRKFDKGDKITFSHLQANHAMSLIGLNLDSKGQPESWQVENSWGYWDNEEVGLDGFLFMSNTWFEKNVLQIAVHKNFLSRTIKNILNTEARPISPWDVIAPAIRIKSSFIPKNYMETLRKRKRDLGK